MRSRKNKLLVGIGAVALLLLNACSPAVEESNEDQLATIIQTMSGMINTPIASTSASCKIVVLERVDCEQKPKMFLYSTQTTDEPQLLELVSEYNKLIQATPGYVAGACGQESGYKAVLQKDICVPMEFSTH